MKKTRIIYWIFTGLLAAMLGIGSVYDAISAPEAVDYVTRLGYPTYLVPFLGVAKLLGILAILVPGFPRVKEWAYAGLAFDLIGAMYSHISKGDPSGNWMFIFIPLFLVAGSYIYHHKLLKTTESAILPNVSLSGN
ncbi:DoxX family protein [Adhaeribacter radiodurans]|uniref:DoxX family protein n=1 Tax=Adhaeribacter radiodurans TaxID=2745197 RepID=A0A7L7L852_9BACT|nr:DoxX family protein [Adhaeribacter radiodurans]QMU29021.1 DoxX family protein [Adhaeribacter radiodurans]